MRHITALDPSELSQCLASIGQPSCRTRQIYHWIYRRGAISFEQMTNLPKSLREKIKERLSFSFQQIVKVLTSKDGTQKFLLLLTDGSVIEAVAIREKRRLTLCLSTQAGCRQGCTFCVTGQIPFHRSLLHHEISDQALVVSNYLRPKKVTNLVLMGMGEPLDDYPQTIKAIKTLIDPYLGAFPPRRITLSTVGLIPGIDELGKENLGIKLAVSLNASNDKTRDALMPVNRRFPLADLKACLLRYPLPSRQGITIEYCLIRGINDSRSCATGLAGLLKGMKRQVKVNLIPYNQNPLLPFYPTTQECLDRFQKCLSENGILSTIRKSKGGDIMAACGQLGYQHNCGQKPV